MAVKIGKNGFGWIGRSVPHRTSRREKFKVVAMKGISDSKSHAHPREHDLEKRVIPKEIAVRGRKLTGINFPLQKEHNPFPQRKPFFDESSKKNSTHFRRDLHTIATGDINLTINGDRTTIVFNSQKERGNAYSLEETDSPSTLGPKSSKKQSFWKEIVRGAFYFLARIASLFR